MQLSKESRRIIVLIFFAGALITAFGHFFLNEVRESHNRLRLDVLTDDIADLLSQSMNVFSYGLGGANGIFAASESVRHDEFRSYVESRNLAQEFPGAFGFGFIEYVKREDLPRFMEDVRADNQHNFEITTKGEKPDLFIIRYIEPESENRPALGFDIGSEPIRRRTAERAMLSGRATISSRVQLVQDKKKESGFLYLKPVFKPHMPLSTPEERKKAIFGWVYAPVTIERVMKTVERRFGSLASIRIFETGEEGENRLIYASPGLVIEEKDFRGASQVKIGQSMWVVFVDPRLPFFEQDFSMYIPEAIWIIGLLFSLRVCTIAWFFLKSRERFVSDRLKRGEDFVQGILDSANFSIFVTDTKGTIKVFNREAVNLLGYTASEIVGAQGPEIIHDPNELADYAKELSEELKQEVEPGFDALVAKAKMGAADENEWTYIKRDGTRFPVQLSVTAIRDDSGQITAYAGIANDITARKLAEKQLIESHEQVLSAKEKLDFIVGQLAETNAELEQATAFKSQFLANMSHEIRTPLTSIIGFSESLLAEELAPEERSDALETILQNGNHLLGVINDILDFSKIEAGKIDIEKCAVSVADLISDVKNLMRQKALEKALSIGFEYTTPVPSMILTDPVRIKQILVNLIGNAVKFTKVGGVKINVSYCPESELISFAVLDTGPGMNAAQRERLFKPFSQADASVTRAFGGTGLGLVISSQLAEQLGGRIDVETILGKGSEFTVSIHAGRISEPEGLDPTASQKRKIINPQAELPQLSGNILVAEDGEDNRKLISLLLRKTGLAFTLVENGALAVEEAGRNHFDLILMDIQMPVMDGYTAMEKLRANGLKTPILALTANALKSDIEHAYASGCTDFLGKPFTRASLYTKIQELLGQGVRHQAPPVQLGEATLGLLQSDPEFLALLVSALRNFPRRHQEMVLAFTERNWETLRRKAHSLCGASGNLGFLDVSNLSREIELSAVNKDEEKTSNLLTRLEVAIEISQSAEDSLRRAAGEQTTSNE